MNRKEIKKKAKEFAFNNKWNILKPLIYIYLIAFVVGFVLGLLGIDTESVLFNIINLALTIALMPMTIGYIYYLIKLLAGEKMDVKEALLCKYKYFGLIFVTIIMIAIFTYLWTLLLIVPGIIYAFKVIMSYNILADIADENTKWKDVINTSKEMMDGYKWDYFVFQLSFLGWVLLGSVTLGIALIWVIPYIQIANVMYYQELKKLKNIQ